MMFLKMLRKCIILVLSFNAVNMLVYSDVAAVTRLSPVNCFKVISMFRLQLGRSNNYLSREHLIGGALPLHLLLD